MRDGEPLIAGEVISPDQIRLFIDKIREVTPLTHHAVDMHGSYVTHFETPDGYISVYRPTLPDLSSSPTEVEMIDDAYRVVVRHEEELDDNTTQVKTQMYAVHELYNAPEYSEAMRLYVNATRKEATPAPELSLEDTANLMDTEKELGMTLFTTTRFDEVMKELGTLHQEDGFTL